MPLPSDGPGEADVRASPSAVRLWGAGCLAGMGCMALPTLVMPLLMQAHTPALNINLSTAIQTGIGGRTDGDVRRTSRSPSLAAHQDFLAAVSLSNANSTNVK